MALNFELGQFLEKLPQISAAVTVAGRFSPRAKSDTEPRQVTITVGSENLPGVKPVLVTGPVESFVTLVSKALYQFTQHYAEAPNKKQAENPDTVTPAEMEEDDPPIPRPVEEDDETVSVETETPHATSEPVNESVEEIPVEPPREPAKKGGLPEKGKTFSLF